MDFGSPSTRKLNLPSTKLWLLVPFAVTLFQVLVSTVDVIPGSDVRQHRQLLDSGVHPQPAARSKKLQPKFAVVSGFVSKQTRAATRSTVDKMYMGHLINKACYCDLWGYDFIFNQSWGFPVRSPTTQSPNGPHWLDYGTWHRVPHIQSAMDAGYEWVLYADVDYVFQDMTLPLESFVKEWSHLGKHNVQVFVPCDGNNLFTFSAFAILIRNSDFGRRLVKNWIKISHGLCPNGNFPSKPGEYSWSDSDQPGLWYALAQTHHEFYPEKGGNFTPKCNQDGYLGTARLMGQELNEYMQRVGAVKSADLSIVPDGTYRYFIHVKCTLCNSCLCVF